MSIRWQRAADAMTKITAELGENGEERVLAGLRKGIIRGQAQNIRKFRLMKIEIDPRDNEVHYLNSVDRWFESSEIAVSDIGHNPIELRGEHYSISHQAHRSIVYFKDSALPGRSGTQLSPAFWKDAKYNFEKEFAFSDDLEGLVCTEASRIAQVAGRPSALPNLPLRGWRPKFDWPAILEEVQKFMSMRRLGHLAELERHVTAWLEAQDKIAPVESTLRAKIAPVFHELARRPNKGQFPRDLTGAHVCETLRRFSIKLDAVDAPAAADGPGGFDRELGRSTTLGVSQPRISQLAHHRLGLPKLGTKARGRH